MAFDCYMKNDLQGHPTATYIDNSSVPIDTAVAYLLQFYDRVEVVEHTQGQSIQLFSGCFPDISAEFIELFNMPQEV